MTELYHTCQTPIIPSKYASQIWECPVCRISWRYDRIDKRWILEPIYSRRSRERHERLKAQKDRTKKNGN